MYLNGIERKKSKDTLNSEFVGGVAFVVSSEARLRFQPVSGEVNDDHQNLK